VQLAVDLDERHRALVLGEDGERGGAEMLPGERVGVGRDGRDGGRTAAAALPKAVDDVLGVDPRPHDDAELGQARANLGEVDGQRLLRGVELGRLIEQVCALGVEDDERVVAAWNDPVTGGITNGRHTMLPC
jgi:hypothetical protein